jgi:DNA-binding CsgD family transcriptional regulator
MGSARTAPGLLLERAGELDAITSAVAAAVAGSGSTLLIEGPAGIGKTLLLDQARARAASAGMTVLTARAAEFEDGDAWGVVRQLFGSRPGRRAAEPEPAPIPAAPAGDAVALARLALSRAERHAAEDTFAVLHGLYWLTADIARRDGPLLLAIDDLHWADLPSQRFAMHLARRLDGLPVLLAATVREPRAGPARDKALTAALTVEPGVWLLRPAALSPAGSARLVGLTIAGNATPAFSDACHELTGGNPLLLRGLLTALTSEGVTGTDADVPHLRRLTPDAVSRHVLLRLARLPADVLATARAIAVLGTSATTTRAARLAGLDPAAAADAVATLMAEHLVTGDVLLTFIHPLVRSVIYTDLAPPLRQRWHKRAARQLADENTAAEVTTHLLASLPENDPWVVTRLRAAAADARARGAPDIALHCLHRALTEPPPDDDRADVLFELGVAETFRTPAVAASRLAHVLELSPGWPRRGEVALALAEAVALSGRFRDATIVLEAAISDARTSGYGAASEPGAAPPAIVTSLESALLHTARWDLRVRPATTPVVAELLARSVRGEPLDPRLHAGLAIEIAVTGRDLQSAADHARAALRPPAQLIRSPALPEAATVLAFAGLADEAWAAGQSWLELARRDCWLLGVKVAAAVLLLIAQRTGDVAQALAYGSEALAGANDKWLSDLAAAFMVPALIDRGAVEDARALLDAHEVPAGPEATWPHNLIRHARGCLHTALGDHEVAVSDLLAAGELAERWGVHNPALMAWRSDAALSLVALGDRAKARRLCAEEIDLARTWGDSRAIGIALRVAGIADGGDRGCELLTESVVTLRQSPARLELARVLGDLGAARRRAGARTEARALLRESLDLAHELGGHAIAARAREELVAAGGRPRRDATRGLDALTPSELRVVQLARAGQSNRQIAQALFVTKRTVENHLTSAYAKLGITARHELAAALTGAAPAPPGARRTALTSR